MRQSSMTSPQTPASPGAPLPAELPGQETCWCGQRAAEVHWSGRRSRSNAVEQSIILRCRSCGTLRSGPQRGVRASTGDGPGGVFVSRKPRKWEHVNARIILKQGVGGPVLEVGANTGMLMEMLIRRGLADMQGLEPNPACVQEARRRGLDVQEGWFLPEQTPAGPFRMIVMSHVLEHIPDPRAALDLAASRLSPGGRLMIFVPNAGSLKARADFGRWGPGNPIDHRWHFEPASLRRLLEVHARFRVLAVFTTPIRRVKWHSPGRLVEAVRERLAARRDAAEQLVAVAELP